MLANLCNHLSINSLIAITQNNRSVAQSKIDVFFTVAIGDFTAFAVRNKHRSIVTPVTIIFGNPLRHVLHGLFH